MKNPWDTRVWTCKRWNQLPCGVETQWKVKVKVPRDEYYPGLLRDYPQLTRVHDLDLRSTFTQIRDVSLLGQVAVLDLGWTCVTNVAPLANVTSLSLWNTPVTDVSPLSRLTRLDLSWCPVTDVSFLGSLIWLDLSSTKVADLTPVSNVPYLRKP